MKPSKIETFKISKYEKTSQLTVLNIYPSKGENQKDLTLSRISSSQKLLNDCKLMIFDKDGTLTHCDKCFGPWIEYVATQLEKEGWIRNARECLEKALLYDLNSQIFDKNSVMIRDTSENIKKALAVEAFRQTNKNTRKNEEVKRLSENRNESFRMFYDQFLIGTDHLLSEVDLSFLNHNTLELCGDKIPEVLDNLKKRGIKMAICTSDDRRITQHTLKVTSFDNYFSAMVCGDDVENVIDGEKQIKFPPKPSPRGIQKLCAILDVNPEYSCMIGDSFTDMEAGIRAGCSTCIFVTEGGHSAQDFVSWLNQYFGVGSSYQENTENDEVIVFRFIFPPPSLSLKTIQHQNKSINHKIDFIVMKNIDQLLHI